MARWSFDSAARLLIGYAWFGLLMWSSVAGAQTGRESIAMETQDSIPLPAGTVRGVAWLSTQRLAVLMASGTTQSGQVSLVILNAAGQVQSQRDFTGILARGLVFDGEFLWSCGDEPGGESLLYKIQPRGWEIEEAYPTPGHHPCDLAFDGEFIWVTDRDSGRMDRFERENGQVTRTVVTPAFSPCGLAHDGSQFWITDSGTGRLYRLTGERGKWTGTVNSAHFAARDRDTVLASSGRTVWYIIIGQDHLRKVRFR